MDKLRLNNSLIGFDGIIGRYNYFYNTVLIYLIASIIFLPFAIWFIINIDSITSEVSIGKIMLNSPLILILTLLALSFTAFLNVSNSIRRRNDILGKINKPVLIIASIFIIVSYFTFLFIPVNLIKGLIFIESAFYLFLLCKYGKITSKYPYDVTKQFNWGAFFGTWIWGLFNKSYKTLKLLFFIY